MESDSRNHTVNSVPCAIDLNLFSATAAKTSLAADYAQTQLSTSAE